MADLPGLKYINRCFTFGDEDEPLRDMKGRTQGAEAQDKAALERGEELPPSQRFSDNSVCTAKYNAITFIPRALFEQFRRLANIYFLGISVLMLIGTYSSYFDSPITPWSTLIPLIFMLAIIMGKEGMEDLKRHKSDKQTNRRKAYRLRPGAGAGSWEDAWEEIAWMHVAPGDLIRIDDRSEIPADTLLLMSSEENGSGFVETANIDGETNLKIKGSVTTAPDGSGPLWECSRDGALAIDSWILKLLCDPPNERIHNFEGTLTFHQLNDSSESKMEEGSTSEPRQVAVDQANLLLRGSTLRNTKWVVGMVVYTGAESKLVMNSSQAPSKFSNLEETVNKLIWIVFGAQFLLSTLSLIGYIIFKNLNYDYLYYLCYSYEDSPVKLFKNNCIDTDEYSDAGYWFTFFILYCNFVPISIYVTIEVVNYSQAFFIDQDQQMYDEEIDMPALARTSNMNSDLGQIRYVFSDKTGTLTQNVMTFKRCSVNGTIFGEIDEETEEKMTDRQKLAMRQGEPLSDLARDATKEDSPAFQFVLCMAACHTVVLEKNEEGVIELQAESPDEEALVKAAKELGMEFVERSPNSVTVLINGRKAIYEIMAVVPFNSTRKRMSVIFKTPQGKYLLMSKGADNVMLGLAKSFLGKTVNADILNDHLDVFAGDGLRTLMLAQRELSSGVFKAWFKKYKEASLSLEDRQGKLDACAEEVEKDLTIIGATAIEDKLQDEVPEVIHELGNAGVKLWVLTGDKMETAINIGYSCRLLQPEMVLIKLQDRDSSADSIAKQVRLLYNHFKRLTEDTQSFAEFWHKLAKKFDKRRKQSGQEVELESLPEPLLSAPPQAPAFDDLTSDHLALIVEGSALLHIIGNPELEKKFLTVAKLCRSVIACRVSPQQKRLLVRLVKVGVKGKPITLAIGDGANDVGMIQEAQVGVGISGKEGRQAVNNSDFAIAQFKFLRRLMLVHGRWDYRRICKVVLYSFYKNMVLAFILFYFTWFDGWSGQSLYESYVYAGYNFFLGMPILLLGVFDRDVSERTSLAYPNLYMSGRENMDMSLKIMSGWLVQGILESIITFFLCWSCYHFTGGVFAERGYGDGIWVFGTTVYSCLIIGMLFKVALMTFTWTGVNWFFWWGSMALFYIFICTYTAFMTLSYDFYYVAYQMMERALYWMLLILLPFMTFLLDLTVTSIRLQFFDNPIDHAIEFDRGYTDDLTEFKRRRRLSTVASRVTAKHFMEPAPKSPNFFGFFHVNIGMGALQFLNQTTSAEDQTAMGIHDTTSRRPSAADREGSRRFGSSFAFDHPTTEYGPGGGQKIRPAGVEESKEF
mmetsp:Transcript_6325/g.8296  ORF Transcript_6325/g.8296 Transcript_6325/m.8296 type:complete len:1313 (-) Transcript_6325:328-4266(-)|eukprot:CAMPEP_0117750946 /NCGR_PEP_ID=MMETSP0947-20121206/10676_1 /TAXON_ID=44440 /ORGANISM="Chattonella subsalsa, Strain CCMP2191" /LENGTH=1312 /DNA_ID=CAMNT_0005569221 /DNA_START=176 /DNA_END=4114 /DNA_ORIENTATION=+